MVVVFDIPQEEIMGKSQKKWKLKKISVFMSLVALMTLICATVVVAGDGLGTFATGGSYCIGINYKRSV